MRFRLFACVVLGAAAVSAGCYESSFPFDRAPQTDLPAGVLGSWRCLPADPDETDEAITVIVRRSKDRRYEVTLQEANQEPDRFEAYASLIKNAPVINLKDLDPASQKPWVFLRTSFLRPNVMAVQIFSDKAVAGTEGSPAGIRKLLEQPQDKGLFEEASVCVKIKP